MAFYFLSGVALVGFGAICWLVIPMLANYVCWKLRMEMERDLIAFRNEFSLSMAAPADSPRSKGALLMVFFAFSTALWFTHGLPSWPYLCLAGLLLLLALVDMQTQLLPGELVSVVLWSGVGAAWAGVTDMSLYACIEGIAVGYAMFTVPLVALKLTTGHEVIGQGDVKLLAACGAWLGAAQVMIVAGLAILLMMGASFAARNRQASRRAFGPVLSASVLVVLFYKQVMQ